jgi:hypothetical protein
MRCLNSRSKDAGQDTCNADLLFGGCGIGFSVKKCKHFRLLSLVQHFQSVGVFTVTEDILCQDGIRINP